MQDQLSLFQGQNEVVLPKPSTKFVFGLLYFSAPQTPLQTSDALSNALNTGGIRDPSIPGTDSPNHPGFLGPTASSITEPRLDQDPQGLRRWP